MQVIQPNMRILTLKMSNFCTLYIFVIYYRISELVQ